MIHQLVALLGASLFVILEAQADTVVFVHGLAGWGPDELLGLGYWGAGQEYFNYFRNKGFDVIEASVGPISSAHDRACELYAQLKCVKTDYGLRHAQYYSSGGAGGVSGTTHQRFGKDYAAMGTNCPGYGLTWDGNNKIHFVGHSFGGNTIRYLEMLLQKGLASEYNSPYAGMSMLFKPANQKTGGGNWIQSMTTIATPHDGSTLTTVLGSGLVETIKDVIAFAAAATDYFGADAIYDFDLDHLGLSFDTSMNSANKFEQIVDQVMSSPIFSSSFKDQIAYDLTPKACQEKNQMTEQAYSGTYYFSFSTDMSMRWLGPTGWYSAGDNIPLTIDIIMAIPAALIGQLDPIWPWPQDCESGLIQNSAYGIKSGGCFVGEMWEPSDGVVPFFSSKMPHTGYSSSTLYSWSGSAFNTGRWYSRNVRLSHLQVIGTPVLCLSVFGCNPGSMVYTHVANTISTLCTGGSCAFSEGDVVKESYDPSDSVSAGADGGMIAGIVIGSLAGVALLAMVAFKAHQRFNSDPAEVRVMSGSWASPVLIKKTKPEATSAEVVARETALSSSENPVFSGEQANAVADKA